jgi:hypothetical protein
MEISYLVFELALIFIPGFIWMKIHRRYGSKSEQKQFDLILNTFIFGVLSYAVLYVIYWFFGYRLQLFDLDVQNKKLFFQPNVFVEIFLASIIAVICGIITLYVENYKCFTKFVQLIGATHTFGGEDLWDYVFSLPIKNSDLVHFRDFEQRVTYSGLVAAYSESEKLRELILDEVKVFDFEGTKMYEMSRMYLARPRENIHLEFPLPLTQRRSRNRRFTRRLLRRVWRRR